MTFIDAPPTPMLHRHQETIVTYDHTDIYTENDDEDNDRCSSTCISFDDSFANDMPLASSSSSSSSPTIRPSSKIPVTAPLQETTINHYCNQDGTNVYRYDDDDDDDDPGLPSSTHFDEVSLLSTKQVRIRRIQMTILHYVLTYPQWSIVLFMYLASMTTTFQYHSTTIVSDTIHNLHVMIQNESKLYVTCVQAGYTLYQQNLNIALQNEIRRVQEYRISTLQPYIHDVMRIESDQCTNTTNAALRALQTWQNTLQQVIPAQEVVDATIGAVVFDVNHTDSCTLLDHQTLRDLIAHDVNMVQNDIRDMVNTYMSETLRSINQLVQYSQDRTMYDYNYFVGIKIQSTMQLLDQFVSTITPTWNITITQLQFAMEIRTLLQDLLDVINNAHLQMDTLTLRLRDFETSINALYLNYMNLYVRFDAIQSFVIDFLPLGMTLPNYFDISDLPLPHTLLPLDFFNNAIPNFNTNVPNIDVLVNTFIEKTLQLLTTILMDVTNDITNQAQLTVQEFIELIRRHMQLNDYDPPKYPTTMNTMNAGLPADMSYASNLAETLQVDLTQSLDALYQRQSNTPIPMDQEPLVSSAPNHLTLNETDPTQFPLLDILYPTKDFYFLPHWLLAMILFIWSHTFMIELLTQAYRLRKLKRKYEQEATPDLPNIDYVVEESTASNEVQEKTFTYRMNILRNIVLQHIMNPWIVVGLILVPFMLVTFVFWFPHVKDSCIDSRRGTYLARNVWKQININRANSQGRIQYNLQQIQCYNRQRYICNTQMMFSDSAYRSDMNTLHTLQTRYNESQTKRNVMGKCVDTNVLDEMFQIHCCGLEGYDQQENCQTDQQWSLCPIDRQIDPPASFHPVSEALSEPACRQYPTLDNYVENAYFNCSTIQQSCLDIPCSGVDENLIALLTIEADCIIEVYAIQICIFIAIAVYHAIMINVINRLLFHGLLQIQWERLKPDGITLITSIDSDGNLTKGDDPHERAELVRRVMNQYVQTGYLQVGMGVAVFVFWTITIFVTRYGASNITMSNS